MEERRGPVLADVRSRGDPRRPELFSFKSRARLVDRWGMKLQPTMTGTTDSITVPDFLQFLERTRANGRFMMGEHALRIADGVVVKATGPVSSTIAALMGTEGEFEFRATPGQPHGELRHPITALLMDAAFAQHAQVSGS
jgi:hypothetical protein